MCFLDEGDDLFRGFEDGDLVIMSEEDACDVGALFGTCYEVDGDDLVCVDPDGSLDDAVYASLDARCCPSDLCEIDEHMSASVGGLWI